MPSVTELLWSPWVPVVVVAFLLINTLISATRKSNVPKSLPWMGKTSDGLFAETVAQFASFANSRKWLAEGYAKYSAAGKSYIFPDVSGRPEIIVPNNKLRWLVEQSDDVASTRAAHYDVLQGDYSFTDPYLLQAPFHEHVIHRNLARKLTNIIPGIWDELQFCFDESWGDDTQDWKDINVMDNMTYVISHVSNRMFVGLPLCRDEAFLAVMAKFAADVIRCMVLMTFVPPILKPLLGPLFSIPNHLHFRQSRSWTLPVIKRRLADIEEKESNPKSKIEISDDYFTWHINQARMEGKMHELKPDMIARFLMPIEFAAIHTTTLTIVNTLLDILGSDPAKGVVEGLREEAERVFKEANGVWTKTAISKLVRADSAVRESMRYSNFATRGVTRKILAPEGLKNDEEGWTAPQGSYVAVDVHSRHRDPKVYPEPEQYDAFRFSRPREEFETRNPDAKHSDEYLRLQNTSITSTGDAFLPFGHGRHACPGRFFASFELKLLLAYLVMNYDIQYLPKRPENQWMGPTLVPPGKATIRVRRRTDRAQ